MTRSSYHRIATLATHPAFSIAEAALRCPLCDSFTTTRCVDYDRHFLAHEPTMEQAERWLSAKRFEKEALARKWLKPCHGSGTRCEPPPKDPLGSLLGLRAARRPCPACGRPLGLGRGRVPPHLSGEERS